MYAIIVIMVILECTLCSSTADVIEIPRHHRDDQILNQMLSIERYDHKLRPEAHTLVNVSVTLLTLSTPDESSLTYEIEFLLHLVWNDHRLKYEDRGKHKYLNALKHWDKLWTPDLYFIKHGKMSHKQVNDIIALKIFNNGDIHYTNRHDMVITCSGNLKIFPFDSPKCNFAIESKFITHERHQLELLWTEDRPIVKSASLSTTNAYLIHNSTKVCSEQQSWRQDYSCLSATLLFGRDKTYYMSVYFVPTMVLVSLTFLSFWLSVEWLAVGRIAINVSSLLGLIMLFITFRSNLPVVSDMTAINLWEFVSMFFVCLANFEFVVQLNRNNTKAIDRRQRSDSERIPEEIEMTEALCDRQTNDNSRIRTKLTSAQVNDNSRLRSFNYDLICKILFPILYSIFVIIYFIVFAAIKSAINFNYSNF